MTHVVANPVDLRRQRLDVVALSEVCVVCSLLVGVDVDNGVDDRHEKLRLDSGRWRGGQRGDQEIANHLESRRSARPSGALAIPS